MIYSEQYWNDVKKTAENIPCLEKLNGSSILITGATGMIGSAVTDILLYQNREKQAGILLYLAGRNKQYMAERFSGIEINKDYIFVEYDATKNIRLEIKADYIIHGASNANPALYTKEPVETILGNIIGLNTLFDLAVKEKAKRLLYISSSEVYGNKTNAKPYEEDDYGFVDILNPRACYPNAKRASENLCVAYAAEYGIETVIVRPGHIYGPTITQNDSRASAQFTWNVLDGHDIVMKSSGMQIRSYCYVLDCASAILTVLGKGKSGNAYNISNRDSVVSIRMFAETLARYTEKKIIFENPTSVEKAGYNLMSNSSLNAEKLEALGWKALFDLQEGVKHTIDCLRR